VVWYRVGSRDERTGETGLSHFLEHMMFKGTDKYRKGEIDLLTSKMGGSNNAFTDTDATAYYFALASDRWETALEIEANRMRQCALDPLEFASEKNVVLEELAMGEDDPWRPLHQNTEALLYQVHPYHHPVIGWRQDVERVTVAQMRGYYERHYGPNRAFLVVVGDVDPERTAAKVRELFGPLPQSAEARAEVAQEPKALGERRAEMHTPHSVTRLCIGFPTCKMGERDDYALDVLVHELGHGKSSRLYQRLVLDEELVTEVSCGHESRLDPGAVFVMCELRDGSKPRQVEDVIREEIGALVEKGVNRKSRQRILAQIRSGYLFEDETTLSQALKLARFEGQTPDGYKTLERVLPAYSSLGDKELREVAGRYLDFRRAVVVWALPEGGGKQKKAARPRNGVAKGASKGAKGSKGKP
jgi:zinc protease